MSGAQARPARARRSFFVTGTDTGVGKTLVACALIEAFAARGDVVSGFKPVACGCDDAGRNEDAVRLRAASRLPLTYGQINPYCFYQPVAPHLAARFGGVRIELGRIQTSFDELAGQSDRVIVEGAGGFLVPLNDKQSFADLAVMLGLPVILVVSIRLGCLNHALLTQQAIALAGLECAGWVANVQSESVPMLKENIEALQERLQAPLLGVVPYMAQPQVTDVAACLDVNLLISAEEAHE